MKLPRAFICFAHWMGFFVLVLALGSSRVEAATLVWTNTAGGGWNRAANWEPNQIPGAGDFAVITHAGSYSVVLDGDAAAAGFVVGETDGGGTQMLGLNGFTLTVSGPGVVNPRGWLLLNRGTFSSGGTNTIAGRCDWGGAALTGAGTLEIAAGATLYVENAESVHDLPGWALNNAGTVVWAGGPIRGGGDRGSLINNSGLWTVTGDDYVDGAYGGLGVVFNNAGIFRKAGTPGNSTFYGGSVFTNSGGVEILTGTLAFTGNYAQTGGSLTFGVDAANFGRLVVGGNAALAGGLGAELLNGFVPATNAAFAVMSFATTNGAFTDFAGLGGGSYRYFKPVLDATTLTLQTRRSPSATNDVVSLNEDTGANVPVLTNDNDAYGFSLAVAWVTQPTNGVVTLNGDNTVHYQPATNYFGPDSFTYLVSNGDGGSSTGRVDVTVLSVNDPSSLAFATNNVVVLEGSGKYSNSIFAGFVPGPANEAGDGITNVVTGNSSNALFSVPPAVSTNGVLTFTPALNAHGVALVTVVAQDNGGTFGGGVDKATNSFTITLTAVNDPPGVTFATNNVVVLEDSGSHSNGAFAGFTSGPADGAGQSVTNVVTINNNAALFSVPPAVDTNGVLTFAVATNASGTAVVAVIAQDNGGIANGGVDKTTNTFTITITAVNDAPVVTFATNYVVVPEDSGGVSVAAFAIFSAGPANEGAQAVLGYTLGNSSNALFSVPPAVGTNGALTFTPATNANGVATVTLVAQDSGGVANGGVDKTTNTFTITITAVNDAPVVTFATNHVVVPEDSGAAGVAAFATFSPGPADESAQTLLGYTLSNTSNALFTAQPALDTAGRLTFTPATNASGVVVVTVVAQDNGGVANGGVDKTTNAFTITITPVNDAPVLTPLPAQFVHAGATLRVTAGATDSDGPAQTLTFGLVSGPAGAAMNPATGEFTWTPTDAQLGATNATVKVTDNGTPNLAATNTFAITVAGRLLLQPLLLSGGAATLVWTAIPGRSYLLQQNGTLGTLTWTNVGGPVTATANTATNVDATLGAAPRRFYRVQLVP